MRRALREFKVVGVNTNIPFHLQVMDNVHFIAGRLDTTFLEKHFRLDHQGELENEKIALVAAALLTHNRKRVGSGMPPSLANSASAWRLQGRRGRLRGRDWDTERLTWRRST